MENIEKLRQFVEAIARATLREEEPEWEEDRTPLSDNNQDITLTQADYADDLILKARKLTEIKGPDIPRRFEVVYKSAQQFSYIVMCLSKEEAVAKFREKHDEEIVSIEDDA